jgi:hypothetical protein
MEDVHQVERWFNKLGNPEEYQGIESNQDIGVCCRQQACI